MRGKNLAEYSLVTRAVPEVGYLGQRLTQRFRRFPVCSRDCKDSQLMFL